MDIIGATEHTVDLRLHERELAGMTWLYDHASNIGLFDGFEDPTILRRTNVELRIMTTEEATEKTPVGRTHCPDCGSALEIKPGCKRCPNCGTGFLSMPDPPNGTRIQLIAAQLNGEWDEVNRILGLR